MRIAIVLALLASVASGQDACGCGLKGAACCSCEYRPANDLCMFDARSRWCEPGLKCDGTACYQPDLEVQSLGPCGGAGEECCPTGWCHTGLTCSNETCVDPNGVVDSSPCGFQGAPCCGVLLECNEDLLCEAGACVAPRLKSGAS